MFRFQFHRFFQIPGDGGAGAGAGAGAPPSATPPPTSGAPPSAAGPAGVGAGPGAVPGAGTPPPGFTYQEDRSQWVPPYRLNEYQQRYQTLEQQFQTMQQRVALMLGVGPQPDPEQQRVQQALIQMFPGLEHLRSNPQAFQRMVEMMTTGRFDEMASAPDAVWRRHAADMGRSAVEAFAHQIGRQPKDLGPNAQRRMLSELNRFIREDPSGERATRYEQGDPTLIEELVADVTGFYGPTVQAGANNGVAAQFARNRALPSAGPRSTPGPQAAAGGRAPFANKKERFNAMRQELLAANQT